MQKTNPTNDNETERRDKSYLIAFLVDHATPETFYSFIDEGHAPHVVKYILGEKNPDGTYKNAVISRKIVTGYPSTSANSHVTLMTGAYQRKTGLLYHSWWDCTGKKPKYVDTDDMSIKMLQKYNYEYISKNVKTIFDYYEKSASFHAINRGATFKLFTPFSLLTTFLPLLLELKGKDDPNKPSPLARPSMWKEIFHKHVSKFLKRVKENGMYDATYIVFLLSDENGHKFGFNSKQYREAVQILDLFVKGLVEGIDDKKEGHIPGLQELGLMDKMNWCICTDHGARPIDPAKMITINTILERFLGLRLLEGKEQKNEKTLKQLKYDYSKLNAFSDVGAEVYHAWFGGPNGTSTGDFTKFYGEDYFRKIIPKRPIITTDEPIGPVDLIEYLIEKEYTQFVIIPEENDPLNAPVPSDTAERAQEQIPREYIIKIFSKDGNAVVERRVHNDTVQYKYTIRDGKDPLGYIPEKTGLEYDKWYSQLEWLEKTVDLELPDVFHRLYGFFDCVYAPNFVLTSAFDYHFWSVYGIAKSLQKSLKNVQNHDGLYSCESIVPLTLAGVDFAKGVEVPFGRNPDVLPTILKAMGRKFDEKEDVDGRVLSEALRK